MVRKINEGAEADIYKTEIFGIRSVIKYRKPKPYREEKLDTWIREKRTKTEAKILYNALKADVSVPLVMLVGKYSIYEKFIQGVQLSVLLKEKRWGSSKKMQESMSKAGKYLAMLHNSDIAHGDFTPANILVGKSNVSIIDFGLSEITNSKENKALDLLLMKRSVSSDVFSYFKNSYLANAKEGQQILSRLSEIERRGRYQVRTLS
ncbi:MAG: KEOPS complex kinase/ATPase Bud32 [Candidatus Micrarchaeia archaeon]